MVYGELPHVYPVTLSEQAGIEGFKQSFSQVLASAGKDADGVLVLCDMQSGTPGMSPAIMRFLHKRFLLLPW